MSIARWLIYFRSHTLILESSSPFIFKTPQTICSKHNPIHPPKTPSIIFKPPLSFPKPGNIFNVFPLRSRRTPEPTLHILTINAYKIPDTPPARAHTYTMHLRDTYLTPTIYIRHTYYTHTIYQPNPIPYTYPTRPIYIHTTT